MEGQAYTHTIDPISLLLQEMRGRQLEILLRTSQNRPSILLSTADRIFLQDIYYFTTFLPSFRPTDRSNDLSVSQSGGPQLHAFNHIREKYIVDTP